VSGRFDLAALLRLPHLQCLFVNVPGYVQDGLSTGEGDWTAL